MAKRKSEIVVDSFAGGGGASLGIAWALGRSPDLAINHDEDALALHALNHPSTDHVCEDVWRARLTKLIGRRKVGLLWASPDCFVAGTLILTSTGLRPIEQVNVGDLVQTHQNRWRKVTRVYSQTAPTVEVRGHGHYGLVTTRNHPFYSKRITKRYPNRKKQNGKRVGVQRSLVENPYWPTAETMKGKLWASPKTFPPSEIPCPSGAEFSDAFFYFIGRWLGDGSFNKGDVVISCGHHESSDFELQLTAFPVRDSHGEIIAYRTRDVGATTQFIWGNAQLVEWIRDNFGEGCEGKHLPPWCLCMQESWRRKLLEGYLDADGSFGARTRASSVSKPLAIGMRLVSVSLGKPASLHLCEGRVGQIEGRSFVGQDQYQIAWRDKPKRETVFWDSRHFFSPVQDVIDTGREDVVFNLEVEEDESYVADGIVVHNCTDHSRAKGDRPIRKHIRSLAWVVCKWASQVKPRIIILENVREFAEWGPLVPQWTCSACDWKGTEGQSVLVRRRRRCPRCESLRLVETTNQIRDPARKGLIFKRWVGRLRNLGYRVEWKNLDAADYGAPTHRKRLFLIARRDGQFIFWPEPTHADLRKPTKKTKKLEAPAIHTLKPYRTAAECIDWNIPCPSIFDRKKPLKPNTERRIALGCKRYVLENPNPYLVMCNHGGEDFRGQAIDFPLNTVTGKHGFGVVTPYLSKYHGQKADESRCHSVDDPFQTLDTQNRFAVVAPSIVNIERSASEYRGQSADAPLNTITANPKGGKHALAAMFLSQYFGNSVGQGVNQPAPTCLEQNHTALTAVHIAKHYGGVVGHDVNRPIGTVTAVDHHSLAATHLVKFRGDSDGRPLDLPMPTITSGSGAARPAGAAHALGIASAYLARFHNGQKAWDAVDVPLGTVTSQGNKFGLCYAFLVKYFGTAVARPLDEPLDTQTGKHRFALVTVEISQGNYEPAVAVFVNGIGWCCIADIGLRMLTPRELARAQGFPDTYELRGPIYRQVAMIGNSVSPVMSKALVEANYVQSYANV